MEVGIAEVEAIFAVLVICCDSIPSVDQCSLLRSVQVNLQMQFEECGVGVWLFVCRLGGGEEAVSDNGNSDITTADLSITISDDR